MKKYNTFGIEAQCAAFINIKSVDDLIQVLKTNTLPIQILGSGSNILLTKEHYDKLFIKNELKGVEIVNTALSNEISTPSKQNIRVFTEDVSNVSYNITQYPESNTPLNYIEVAIGSGENWHGFVELAVKNGWGGIENLSLIPGTMGAAPIQNIGAYGVELKDTFTKLEALNLKTLEIETFTNAQCAFGYRNSIFKTTLKDQYFITKIYLKLTVKNHTLHTAYGDIEKVLQEKSIDNPSIQDVSNAVIQIRQSKLPDPSVIGNAGSFFKNPEIPTQSFQDLRGQFPDIIGYPTATSVKVAAGWLIEQCGWKGKRFGDIGVHERQALVLVNYGNGHGSELKQLAEQIQASVEERFNIRLEAEVNMI